MLENARPGVEALVVHLKLRLWLCWIEIQRLTPEDIQEMKMLDPETKEEFDGFIHVHGKGRGGGKWRTPPYAPETRDILREYDRQREHMIAKARELNPNVRIPLDEHGKEVYVICRRQGRLEAYSKSGIDSMWQLDYTMLRDGLWLLLIVYDHSRFIIGHRFMPTPKSAPIISLLETCFSKYGVPKQLLTDYGTQFFSVKGNTSEFDRFCLSAMVEHILASAMHPQTVGKLERKNGVLKEYLEDRMTDPAWFTNYEIRELVNDFVVHHNNSRTHFTYEAQELYSIGKRRKVLFLPYLRFVCHR